MKIIGITGNIGSGKTLFCNYLEEMGAVIFSADKVAKDLMTNNTDIKSQIIAALGNEAYTTNGELNRKWLAEQAFKFGKSGLLNQIVHPAVATETKRRAQVAKNLDVKLFVKEAALLLNEGRDEIFDYVVWIQAPLDTRVQRVISRDNTDINEVLQRDEKQKKLHELASLIDEIVINDGTTYDLKKKAMHLFHKLVN
ncbi:MAG: dephospho-CoA kinase [Bacteroidetes bacterium]|nr:dephospho-CoA kinase [Bacteroidota bacterium]MCH8522959.1 dephospho-CoA kinase [Balneolales bacterium]